MDKVKRKRSENFCEIEKTLCVLKYPIIENKQNDRLRRRHGLPFLMNSTQMKK